MKAKDRKTTIREDLFLVSKYFETIGDQDTSGITIKQYQLLSLIATQPPGALTLTGLARLAGSSRQNVKKIAGILERKGRLLIEKDTSDARVLRIKLSESGAALLNRRQSFQDDNLEEIFAGIDDKSLKAFAKTLARMRKNCQRVANRANTDYFLIDDEF